MSKIKPEVAQRRIKSFTKRFGEAHLYLAYHAAFPLALTPDLLYSLWVNFQQDTQGKVLGIPWIAVADLLLSALCDEVGHELYEMDLAVRNQLLKELQLDERFGKRRINELSNFLLEYVQKKLLSNDPDIQDFAKTQQWMALAYTQPSQAAREIALAFSMLNEGDKAEMLRMASLTETFAEPLREFQPLLTYARGISKFARGDLLAAKAEFAKVLEGRKYIEVEKVFLPVFDEIGLKTFSFETVTVDGRGNIINRHNCEARYFIEDLGNGVTLEMIHIPGGTFTMGSPAGKPKRKLLGFTMSLEDREKGRSRCENPQHTVTIQPFFMGRYAVTQAQYQTVMGENPSVFKGENRPVEQVSWNNAVEFCKRLSQRAGCTYRLPSEAEWEYACRAGTTTPFHFGETITTDLVNYNGHYTYASAPKCKYRQQTIDVENFFPNSFGLYQMHGNVWEWCLDTWHESYEVAPPDAAAWIGNNKINLSLNLDWEKFYRCIYSNPNVNLRVLRGGSWSFYPEFCRSAFPIGINPDDASDSIGLRVVCVVSPRTI
ncbi:MAG: formylglycine-generating enzyme family protein [Cyanobacteria bacterium J06629_18]